MNIDVEIKAGHWTAEKEARMLPPHTNPGLEIVLVANGAVSWDYDGLAVDVPAGSVSYSWPWQVHGARDVELPAVEFYWILVPLIVPDETTRGEDCRVAPEYGLGGVEGLLASLAALETPVVSVSRDFRFYFTRLVEALIRKEGGFDWEARGLFMLSMYQLGQSLAEGRRQSEGAMALVQVKEFWEGLDASGLEHRWTLDEMAAACGMGRSSFAMYTKQLCGDTPVAVLTRKRLDQAKTLLRQTALPVTEIALCCGFGSSQHFATVFQSYTKMTPSGYRAKSPE